MFIVKRVLKRGIFRDKVLIASTEDASLRRKRLGWDLLQAPDLKMENLKVVTGQELRVSLAKNSVTEGQSISVNEVTKLTAFNSLWKKAEA
jgi:hypothetical protein